MAGKQTYGKFWLPDPDTNEVPRAKFYLESFQYVNIELGAILEEYKALGEDVQRITSTIDAVGGSPGSPDPHRFEDAVIRLEDRRAKLIEEWDFLQNYYERGKELVDMMPDPVTRGWMKMRYLEFLPPDDVAEKLHYTKNHMYLVARQHGFSDMQEVLDREWGKDERDKRMF